MNANDLPTRPAANGANPAASPARGAAESPRDSVEKHPARVGPYRILQVLGEGGMGVVYLAEQTEPVRRRVALKLVKLGMDTREVIARFESERQALALMNHPNVAAVLDAGATEQGRPYFVMEYVPGVPITDYCDRHKLTTRERLELFMQVCHAVQHAHQKGIIHRDIKPSNVLVALSETPPFAGTPAGSASANASRDAAAPHARPVPKVIDFGVAKATNQRLTEQTIYTQQGQLIGTPEYMSPEQAEMNALDVDTRTDVYSLGVLLYELLVGALPFDHTSLRKAGYYEIQRIIREIEPPRPSTKLSTLGEETALISERRRLEPKALAKQLRGDLDWIIMKALDKDRTRRYATPTEFAADLARHLGHEPVLAGPPGVGYRAKKFLRRYRGPAAVVMGFTLLLFASSVVTGFLYFRAERATHRETVAREKEAEQRKLAEAAKADAERASMKEIEYRKRAEANAEAARQAAEKSKKIQGFLQTMLASIDPQNAKGVNITMREVIDEAAKHIQTKFQDEPEVQADLFLTMGQTYAGLGLYEQARSLLRATLEIRQQLFGNESLEVAEVLMVLAGSFRPANRETLACCQEAVAIRSKLLGPTHELTASSKYLEAQLMQTLENTPESLQTALQWAIPAFLAQFEIDEFPQETADTLATTKRLWETGDTKEAIAAILQWRIEEIARIRRLWQAGQRDAARQRVRRHCDPFLKRPQLRNAVAWALCNFSNWITGQEDDDGIEPLKREAVAIAREIHGEQSIFYARALAELGFLLARRENYGEAETILREALLLGRELVGDNHEYVARGFGMLLHCLWKQEKYAEAEAVAREWNIARHKIDGGASEIHEESLGWLYMALWQQGKLEEAEKIVHEIVKSRRKVGGPEPLEPLTLAYYLFNLAKILIQQEKYKAAESPLLEAYSLQRRILNQKHYSVLQTLDALIMVYEALDKPEQAAAWRAKRPATQPASQPVQSP